MSLHTPLVLRVPIWPWSRYEWDASASPSSGSGVHGWAASPCLEWGTGANRQRAIAHVSSIVPSVGCTFSPLGIAM